VIEGLLEMGRDEIHLPGRFLAPEAELIQASALDLGLDKSLDAAVVPPTSSTTCLARPTAPARVDSALAWR